MRITAQSKEKVFFFLTHFLSCQTHTCPVWLNLDTFFSPKVFICMAYSYYGLPWWLTGKEIACQCRRHGLDPWIGKISWRRKQQTIFPSSIFAWEIPWTEEPGGLQSCVCAQSLSCVWLFATSWTRLSDWLNNNSHHSSFCSDLNTGLNEGRGLRKRKKKPFGRPCSTVHETWNLTLLPFSFFPWSEHWR